MKFFVMLAVLILRDLPGEKLTRPVDRAFRAWQGWLAGLLGRNQGQSVTFLLAVLPLVILLWLLLWWVEGYLWSLPTLVIHLLVVFYALGRRSELLWVERYMIAWRQGDQQAASYYAEEILGEAPDADACRTHARVISRLTYFAFDRLFLVLFWYLLLGPVGALLARLSEQAIQNARAVAGSDAEACDEQVVLFHQVLEWPAARLMGLTLGLLGRPLLGLQQFVLDCWRWRMASEPFLNRQLVSGFGVVSKTAEDEDLCGRQTEMMSDEADRELMQLKERVWRSLGLWVAITAWGVIFWT